MALAFGTKLGPYDILASIGAGGMGEVYRARDTKLAREVAIKVLPEAFAHDPDRRARFEREAKLLAALNHPHIAAIYGIEESGGISALVMELVEGETLAERIAGSGLQAAGSGNVLKPDGRSLKPGGALPVDEALNIARQMAEALEAAHEKGIVHRDLKPANVKITPEGKVKVLDFGLAKALEEAAPSLHTNSPTLSVMATHAGVILGTAGYMSPEQARGHAADARSDIFSFACVLYEMLTGRQAFPGETVTDVIASIVARDPDWRAIPADLHPKIEELIRRCLAKNRKDRWHAIADVRVEIEAIMTDPHGLKLLAVREVPRQRLWRRAIPIGVTAVLVAGIAVATTVAVMNSRPSRPTIVTRFPFVLPEGQRFTNVARNLIALSPDGTMILYEANRQLWLRSMSDMESRPIPGTAQDASSPFFSPDGRWVGFFSRADNKLKKIAISGGAAVTICDVQDTSTLGPMWNADDYIYVGGPGWIGRVSANGGKLERLVTLKDDETAHRPQLLPGGDALLFTLGTGVGGTGGSDRWDKAQIVVQSSRSGARKVLIPGGSDGRYVPTGHIIYALGTTVLAVPFDVHRREVTGGPVPIVEGARRSSSGGGGGADAQFAFASNGSMVYVPGSQAIATEVQLVLVDRSGARKPLNIPARPYASPRVSPNGKQLAIVTDDGKDRVIWVGDLDGTAPLHKLTFEGHNDSPVWTRDGQHITFRSDREGDGGLFSQRVDGGPAKRLAKLEQTELPQPEAWSPDGKLLVFTDRSGGRSGGVWTLAIEAEEKPKLIVKPLATNSNLSPDGRWLAYHGREPSVGEVNQIYVQPAPPTGEKHQITTTGGVSPLWSPDGKQLFFIGLAERGSLMAVDVHTERGFSSGRVTPLPVTGLGTNVPRPYDITPDGKYFLVMVPKAQAEPSRAPAEQINVTLNWFTELQQRVPTR